MELAGLGLGELQGAAAGSGKGAPVAGGRGFGAALEGVVSGKVTLAEKQAHAQAQKAAGGLVANALILPVLKQVRRSHLGEKGVFSGGIGESSFGPQFDMEIADRLANSPQMAATQALTARLEKRHLAAMKAGKTTGTKKLDVHG